VVDFGAFVDIEVKQDGLVHVSEMGERYVRDPHQALHVGDVIRVRVIKVSGPALSAIEGLRRGSIW